MSIFESFLQNLKILHRFAKNIKSIQISTFSLFSYICINEINVIFKIMLIWNRIWDTMIHVNIIDLNFYCVNNVECTFSWARYTVYKQDIGSVIYSVNRKLFDSKLCHYLFLLSSLNEDYIGLNSWEFSLGRKALHHSDLLGCFTALTSTTADPSVLFSENWNHVQYVNGRGMEKRKPEKIRVIPGTTRKSCSICPF